MSQYTTRSGRIVKKPELFKPTEDTFIDDYSDREYDTDDLDSELDTDEELDSDSDEYSTDDGEDLEDFIVPDDDEEDA